MTSRFFCSNSAIRSSASDTEPATRCAATEPRKSPSTPEGRRPCVLPQPVPQRLRIESQLVGNLVMQVLDHLAECG